MCALERERGCVRWGAETEVGKRTRGENEKLAFAGAAVAAFATAAVVPPSPPQFRGTLSRLRKTRLASLASFALWSRRFLKRATTTASPRSKFPELTKNEKPDFLKKIITASALAFLRKTRGSRPRSASMLLPPSALSSGPAFGFGSKRKR